MIYTHIGRAFLFKRVVNLTFTPIQDRVMLTGRHMVRDVYCKNCKTKLGWMYEFATEESQKYVRIAFHELIQNLMLAWIFAGTKKAESFWNRLLSQNPKVSPTHIQQNGIHPTATANKITIRTDWCRSGYFWNLLSSFFIIIIIKYYCYATCISQWHKMYDSFEKLLSEHNSFFLFSL